MTGKSKVTRRPVFAWMRPIAHELGHACHVPIENRGPVKHHVDARAPNRDFLIIPCTGRPQIACFGNQHFSVTKTAQKGRTLTAVARLDEQDRLHEIARMLGGKHITDATTAHARDMLQQAAQ